jgi:hypothetical protein
MNEESTGHCESKINAPTALRTQTGVVYLLAFLFGIAIHIIKAYREDFRISDAQIYNIFGMMLSVSFIVVSYIAFKFSDETVAEIRCRSTPFGQKWGALGAVLLFIPTICLLYYIALNFEMLCDNFIYRNQVK